LGAVTAIFFALVVVASGFSAIVLLAWPGSTATTFSWTLRPVPAAAVIGGLYLVSAIAFGAALTHSWREVRGLWVAVYGLAVPTVVETLLHRHLFTFSRWQALAWLAIFVGTPFAVTWVLARQRRPSTTESTPRPTLTTGRRLGLAGLAIIYGTVGAVALVEPGRQFLSEHGPFAIAGLTGAYLGAWCCFAALLAIWSALAVNGADARFPTTVLALLPVGALVGLTRFPGTASAADVAVLVALGITAFACRASRPITRPAASR
jgi:hypothetical protein